MERPGWGFILGEQDSDFPNKAGAKWLAHDQSTVNISLYPNSNERFEFESEHRAVSGDEGCSWNLKKTVSSSFIEILPDSTLSADKAIVSGTQPKPDGFISYFSVYVQYGVCKHSSLNSTVFKQFSENINIIKSRLNGINSLTYETQSQDVMIRLHCGLHRQECDHVSLSPFPNIPIPNWRLTSRALKRSPRCRICSSRSRFNHAYNSTYSVLNYSNSLLYNDVGVIGLNNRWRIIM